MPACVSEALVLRTYPLKEADLIVSFFARDQGKLRGVAKRARRPKSNFGAGLERLSHVRMAYTQRETRELVNLESSELIHSQFGLISDYWTSVALDYFAEVSEQLLPSAEPSEKFFRLLLAVLESLQAPEAGKAWRAVTYFSLWSLRLSGWLPELHVCLGCGSLLDDPGNPQRAFFGRGQAGLMCSHCRRSAGGSSWELSAESRTLAERNGASVSLANRRSVSGPRAASAWPMLCAATPIRRSPRKMAAKRSRSYCDVPLAAPPASTASAVRPRTAAR